MKNERPTLNALIARSVLHGEGITALKDERARYTYGELARLTGSWARVLAERGVRRGDRVVVYAERSAGLILAILGVLKAGAAFVPVALDAPPERLQFILQDVEARLLLTDEAGLRRLGQFDCSVAMLDVATVDLDGVEGLSVDVEPSDVAYVIYTSGTSGRPKGVIVEHGSIAHRFEDWDHAFQHTNRLCRLLQAAQLGFDVFVGDLVKALCSGGTLVVCPKYTLMDPEKLYRTLVDEAVDYVDTVPGVMRMLVEYLEKTGQDLRELSVINCGAEKWSKEEYAKWKRVTRVQRLVNGYGVTECTVESTLFEDSGENLGNWKTLPIGSPMLHDDVIVVDGSMAPVPAGVEGQICLGGPCVARGYVNRPELDESAFAVLRNRSGELSRYYKTGDLGRFDENGVLELLGRMDSQVKFNGRRVELEEIQRVIEGFAGVTKAVVSVDAQGAGMIGFVQVAARASFRTEDCVEYLKRFLPKYMVPRSLIVVERFPMTSNGKIDKAQLLKEHRVNLDRPHEIRRHDLHGCRTVAQLQERLRSRDIDLPSVISEFVKPGTDYGAFVIGAIAAGKGSETSPVELLIVLPERFALKGVARDASNQTVERLPGIGSDQRTLVVGGIDLILTFVAEPLRRSDTFDSDWIVRGRSGAAAELMSES